MAAEETAVPIETTGADVRVNDSENTHFDEEWLFALAPYEVLDNPVLGHQYRFLHRLNDESDDRLFTEFRLQADAKHFGEHIHPEQEETWRVLSGAFGVVVNDEKRTLGPGEEITLPAGVPHYHGNVSGIEARLLHEIRPAMDFEAGLRMFCHLAEAGKTNANGENLLATAVFLSKHPNQLYMANPSIRVQNLILKALAPLGRVLGYEADYPPAE